MTLRELEQVLRGYVVASVQWRDENRKVQEVLTHIHLIKFFNDYTLDKEVARVEFENNSVEIFLR